MIAEPHGSGGKNWREKESLAQVRNSRQQTSGRDRRKRAPVGGGKERGAQLRVTIQQPAQVSQAISIKSFVPVAIHSRMHVVNAETDRRLLSLRQPIHDGPA